MADRVNRIRGHCEGRLRREEAYVFRQIERGRTGIARKRMLQVILGIHCRMHHAFAAMDSLCAGSPPSFSLVWDFAQQLKNFGGISSATSFEELKPHGGFRTLIDFDAFDRARQKMLVRLIQPFAGVHSMKGVSRTAACESLLKAMNGVIQLPHRITLEAVRRKTTVSVLLRNARFIEIDVRNCFGSISHRWCEERLSAPRDVIRSILLLQGWTIRGAGYETDGQRGVPQGSVTSAAVGEFVMTDVAQVAVRTCKPLFMCRYADNIGMLIADDADEQQLRADIQEVFRTHPAGPFCVRITSAVSLSSGFQFLGYWFGRPPERRATILLPPGAHDFQAVKFISQIMDAEDQFELEAVRERLNGYRRAQSLASDAWKLIRDVAPLIRGEIEHRRQFYSTYK